MSGTPVILFKTHSEPPSSDAYHIRLTEAGFRPLFVPVLAERWVLSQLVGILRGDHAGLREKSPVEGCAMSGTEDNGTEIARDVGWEGVIVSSRRGAEGWIQAAKEASSGSERSQPSWNDIPLFTVGTSALDVFRESHLHIPPNLQPNLDTSVSAKSASLLVPAIIDLPPRSTPVRGSSNDDGFCSYLPEHLQSQKPNGEKDTRYGRYLVIRGDKSLDEIPRRLKDAGREVVEVIVYETAQRGGLESNLRSVMAQLLGSRTRGEDDGAESIWLGFFSPSSAGMVLPHLCALLDSPAWRHPAVLPRTGARRGRINGEHEMGSSAEAASGDVAILRFAAIGETTRAYLESFGMEVAAVAEQPTAEGLVEAIWACACK